MKAKMTHPLRVVAVSGGLQRPHKSALLAEHLLDLIADEVPCQQRLIEMGKIAPLLPGAVWRSQLSDTVEQELAAVEQADVLVVVTPVFRGSYTGVNRRHDGARRLGVPVATMGNWCRRQREEGAKPTAAASPGTPPSRRPVSDLEAEVSRLRKKLASAKLDIEILRKATAYFAKGSR